MNDPTGNDDEVIFEAEIVAPNPAQPVAKSLVVESRSEETPIAEAPIATPEFVRRKRIDDLPQATISWKRLLGFGLLIAVQVWIIQSLVLWVSKATVGSGRFGTENIGAVRGIVLLAVSLAMARAIELALVRWVTSSRTKIASRFFACWGVSLCVTGVVHLAWVSAYFHQVEEAPSILLVRTLFIVSLLSFPPTVFVQLLIQFLVFRRQQGVSRSFALFPKGVSNEWLTLASLAVVWIVIGWLFYRFQPLVTWFGLEKQFDTSAWSKPMGIAIQYWVLLLPVTWLLELLVVELAIPFLAARRWFSVLIMMLLFVGLVGAVWTVSQYDLDPLEFEVIPLASNYWGAGVGLLAFGWLTLWHWLTFPGLQLARTVSVNSVDDNKAQDRRAIGFETPVFCALLVVLGVSLFTWTGGLRHVELTELPYTTDGDIVRRLWPQASDASRRKFFSEMSEQSQWWEEREREFVYQLALEALRDPDASSMTKQEAAGTLVSLNIHTRDVLELWFDDGEIGDFVRRAVNSFAFLRLCDQGQGGTRREIIERVALSNSRELHEALLLPINRIGRIGIQDYSEKALTAFLESPNEDVRMMAVEIIFARRARSLYDNAWAAIKAGYDPQSQVQRSFTGAWNFDWEPYGSSRLESTKRALDCLLHPDHTDAWSDRWRTGQVVRSLLLGKVTWQQILECEPAFLDRLVLWQVYERSRQRAKVVCWMIQQECFTLSELEAAFEQALASIPVQDRDYFLAEVEVELDRSMPLSHEAVLRSLSPSPFDSFDSNGLNMREMLLPPVAPSPSLN